MATYSISGSLGPSQYVNVNTNIISCNPNIASGGSYATNVSPNSSGAYTISGLTPGTYIIQAMGSNFLVAAQTVTITNANVTGINFTVTVAQPNTGTFTEKFSDTFIRANEVPLSDGGPWSPPNNNTGLITSTYLQIVSDQCTTEQNNQYDGAAVFVDVAPYNVLPQNQYASFRLKDFNNGFAWLYVRGTLPGNTVQGQQNPALNVNYDFFVGIDKNYNGGKPFWGVGAEDDDSSNVPYAWVTLQDINTKAGDYWTFAIQNPSDEGATASVLYVFLNNTCIWQALVLPNPDVSKMLSNGTVGLQIDSLTPALSDISVTNFVAGSFSVS